MAVNLWRDPLPAQLDWADVDAFLQLKVREGPQLEYRSRLDAEPHPLHRRPHGRLPDTVGAMANGSGGLILIGVETDEFDMPKRWPTLRSGQVKPQAVEGQVRNFVEPYVPVEVAAATAPEGKGDIVVVRVPEGADKPVFVSDRGILIREGEASVPASVAVIRGWLTNQYEAPGTALFDFTHYISDMVQSNPPLINIGAYPARRWYTSSWDDDTDDSIGRLVQRQYPALSVRTVSDDLLDFRPRGDGEELTDWIWFKPSGAALRRRLLDVTADRRIPLTSLATEIGLMWLSAQEAIPTIMPGYIGPIGLGLAVGTVEAGFSSRDLGDEWLDAAQYTPRNRRRAWAKWHEYHSSDAPTHVVATSLATLLRGFGYSGAGAIIRRVVDAEPWASME